MNPFEAFLTAVGVVVIITMVFGIADAIRYRLKCGFWPWV
jgi:hypothetical protein